MKPRESRRMRLLAVDNLAKRFPSFTAHFSSAVVEQLLLGEAALLVLAQALPEYARAQELIRAAVFDESG